MTFPNQYSTLQEKLCALQRWIIVQSIIYYELNKGIVSDLMYDRNCKQLLQLKTENEAEYEKSQYYYCMFDFDGTTGFDLYSRLNENDKKRLKQHAYIALCK